MSSDSDSSRSSKQSKKSEKNDDESVDSSESNEKSNEKSNKVVGKEFIDKVKEYIKIDDLIKEKAELVKEKKELEVFLLEYLKNKKMDSVGYGGAVLRRRIGGGLRRREESGRKEAGKIDDLLRLAGRLHD